MSTTYKHFNEVPSWLLADRLEQLSDAVCDGKEAMEREFTRRIPAELDRDADLVLQQAAQRIRELEQELSDHRQEQMDA